VGAGVGELVGAGTGAGAGAPVQKAGPVPQKPNFEQHMPLAQSEAPLHCPGEGAGAEGGGMGEGAGTGAGAVGPLQ
jgi:hypothetical protein